MKYRYLILAIITAGYGEVCAQGLQGCTQWLLWAISEIDKGFFSNV